MLVVLGIVIFFFGLLASIAWHELGHLATAKLFGIKVTQYMVGFGRTLFSRKKGETEYGVKAIPFGGYIRMIGMFPPKPGEKYGRSASSNPVRTMIEEARDASREEVAVGDEDRQFYQRRPWKRVIVMAAGPLMNLLLAIALFATVLMGFGIPKYTNTVSQVSECVMPATAQPTQQCPPDAPKSPAAAAGLRPGDRIISFNGQHYDSWRDLQRAIRDTTGPASLTVQRGDQQKVLHPNLMPTQGRALDSTGRADPSGKTVTIGFLGLFPSKDVVRMGPAGVARQLGDMVTRTGQAVVRLPERVPSLFTAIAGGKRSQDSPMGVVGVSRVGGEVLSTTDIPPSQRIALMLELLAAVNLSLCVMNLLPLLPLDGGHIVGAVWESIRRGFARLRRRADPGPFDVAKLMPVAYAASMVIIAYAALVLVADIVNPVQLF